MVNLYFGCTYNTSVVNNKFVTALQTLYTYPESFRSYKIQIAARYSGAELRVVSEPPEFELGKTNKSDVFVSKFPLGKVWPSCWFYRFESGIYCSLSCRSQRLRQQMALQSMKAMLLHTMVKFM